MIRKIKSTLAVKVFLITFLLMVSCCSITYFCIARFSPYIYSHKLSDTDEIANLMSIELSCAQFDEAEFFISAYSDKLSREFDGEFVFHIFQDSGEELALPDLDTFTGARIDDYKNVETTKEYRFFFADGTGECVFLLTKNTNKESQVIEALKKSLPVLSAIVFAASVIAALFYTWYMTKPIRKISALSKRMADMDFSGKCPTGRTDEIGVLSDSLNEMSGRLSTALSELKNANEKLQADIDKERQLERQRAEFFSAASHELKTPITIIKGQLQGMLYQVGRYKDRETYLAQSLKAAEALESLVQELLTLSRLDAPGYVCNKCDFDFSRLVYDRIAAHEDLFLSRALTVEKEISREIFVSGDARLLQKVLDNLLGNAAAYSPAGGRVSVKLRQDGGKVKLSVENTGVHIPEEDIPKLSEAFYRVDRSRSRQTGGTGLGLYIVKTILSLHGAEIEISNSNQGVLVSVEL